MNKLYFFILALSSAIVYAQVADIGTPRSQNLNLPELQAVVMPGFDLDKYIKEDAQPQKDLAKPYRFGHNYEVNLSTENSGRWTTLENGDRIWQLRVQANLAKTLNFKFTNYQLAEGAELYLYNNYGGYLGSYTSKDNIEIKELGTWLIDGDDVTIEFYEPSNVIGQSSLTLSQVTHGYRTASNLEAKGLNTSGHCNVDVDCAIGNAWENQKKGVVMLISGSNGFCSGSLVTNTDLDNKPYILTANHCTSTSMNTGSTYSIPFRFNWKATNPICPGTGTNSASTFLQTTSGATFRMRHGQSDTALFEVSSPLPTSWNGNIYFQGWDRTASAPSMGTGIHHPDGDVMKISQNQEALTSQVSSFNGFSNVNFWRVNDWEIGVTEPGSSGSPIFNQNGLVVGVLSAGSAACSGTTDNGGFDIYGKFVSAWTGGGTNASRLSNWLDPNNTGVTNTSGHVLSTEDITANTQPMVISPNPSNGIYSIQNSDVQNLKYSVFNSNGQLITNGTFKDSTQTINITDKPNGVYILQLENNQTFKLIKK